MRRGPKPQQRLAAAPLLALAGCRDGERNIVHLARCADVRTSTVYRFIRDGLTWSMADRLAVRLGYHPAEIWGRSWWEMIDAA